MEKTAPLPTAFHDPDADLLPGLAAGEQDALRQLMDRHLSAIKALAWQMLHNDHDAEDIAQEVFIRTWKQAPNWQSGRAKLLTWMRRVTTNLCLDRLRKKKEILTDEVPDMADTSPLATEALSRAEASHTVRNAISFLPDSQRSALILFHFQELTQKEAAAVMDINIRAFESLLARARRALKDRLFTEKSELLSEYTE